MAPGEARGGDSRQMSPPKGRQEQVEASGGRQPQGDTVHTCDRSRTARVTPGAPALHCSIKERGTPRQRVRWVPGPHHGPEHTAPAGSRARVPVCCEVSLCAGSRGRACWLRMSQSLWGSRGSSRSMGQLDFISCLLRGLEGGSSSSPLTPTPQRPSQTQVCLGALMGMTTSCPAFLRATAGDLPALGPQGCRGPCLLL